MDLESAATAWGLLYDLDHADTRPIDGTIELIVNVLRFLLEQHIKQVG